ncbi:MAG: ornithine carbamoyltransferase [Rhodospirillales bacterium]|jgi:ornithine carbamoyltransferase|nr:ornithine carbamoyltransferase [Rhodospirillales bacterium]
MPHNNKAPIRHFLDLDQFCHDSMRDILNIGVSYKHERHNAQPLVGKTLAMIFEKPSTRTRVSFQVGMQELGGSVVVLSGNESQLGQGETVADTARVLSRYVDAIMIRTNDHNKLDELAKYATVPVINGLTDDTHPCQLMADIMTFEEHRGTIGGKTLAWCGDGNNVAASWAQAAARFDFTLHLATPDDRRVDPGVISWAEENGAKIIQTNDANSAVEGADAVITDAWISMGDDVSNAHNLFMPFQVNEALMAKAKPDALFMHCLPVHRGEEVTDGVIDGPQSVVWDEAENRLHAQKGILVWSMVG